MSAGLPLAPSWTAVPARRVLVERQEPTRDDDEIVTCFRDGQVTLRRNRREEGFTNAIQEHGYKAVEPGDLVVHSMDAFAGAIGVSDSRGKMSPVVGIYATPLGDPRFYSYYLRACAYSGYIESLAKGIRERSTSFDRQSLGNLAVPDLPVEEQRRIADFLDDQVVSLDRAISSTVAQESLLGEALSGHVSAEVDRLADEFGAVPLRRYVHGIEQGWSPECSSEPASADEDGVLKLGAVGPGHFRSEENKAMLPGVRPDPRYALAKGDLLITRANTRDLVGQCAVVPADFPRLYLCDLVYRVHVSKLEPEFVVVAMQSGRVRGLLATTARGTSGTMVKLRGDDIREIPIPAAPTGARLAAVRSFAEHQAHFEEGTLALTRRRELLAERKRSLITKAVTGELDVTTAKPIGMGRWLASVTAKAGPAATTSLNIGGA